MSNPGAFRTRENGREIDIDYDMQLPASLNYSINSIGIKLYKTTVSMDGNPTDVVMLRAINSRGTISPGFIGVPINKLAELIDALAAIRQENPIK